MCKTKIVQIRFSPKQYQLLINRMENAGHRTVSSFVRDAILKDDMVILNLIKQIHEKVVEVQNE